MGTGPTERVESIESMPPRALPAAVAQSRNPAGFPRTSGELAAWFAHEIDCHDYLSLLRWSAGFACPFCSTQGPQHGGGAIHRCGRCGAVSCATTGTPLAGVALTGLFRALWDQLGSESAADAERFAGLLGATPEECWRLLERLRGALVRHDEDRLVGQVHAGQFVLAIDERDAAGRILRRQHAVLALAEVRQDEVTRVRFGLVRGCALETRLDLIRRAVAAGATVRTGRSPVWDGLPALGYDHHAVGCGSDLPPGVRRAAAVASLWLYGSAGLRAARLGYYLDELSFRFNHRFAARPEDRQGYLFFLLLRRALQCAAPALVAEAADDVLRLSA